MMKFIQVDFGLSVSCKDSNITIYHNREIGGDINIASHPSWSSITFCNGKPPPESLKIRSNHATLKIYGWDNKKTFRMTYQGKCVVTNDEYRTPFLPDDTELFQLHPTPVHFKQFKTLLLNVYLN